MRYLYTEKDLDLISWNRIDEFIDKIYNNVSEYIKQNNLKIKYISPIMRGGTIPAVILSHMFNVIDMLPIQLKYNSDTKKIELKIGLNYIENKNLKENECILLVEGNHVTGQTANTAIKLIRAKFGNSAKIIYVSLTRDCFYKNSANDVEYTTWGMTTNESKKLSQEECNKLNINYNLVSVYPWEDIMEELEELNIN